MSMTETSTRYIVTHDPSIAPSLQEWDTAQSIVGAQNMREADMLVLHTATPIDHTNMSTAPELWISRDETMFFLEPLRSCQF